MSSDKETDLTISKVDFNSAVVSSHFICYGAAAFP